MLQFSNYVGGTDTLLSNKRFVAKSQFYDFETEAPDSNLFDLKVAVSKARSAIDECHALTFEEKRDILARAASLTFTDANKEYIVKMTGMPRRDVDEHLAEIPGLMRRVPEYIGQWAGTSRGTIGGALPGTDLFRVLHPMNGTLYAVTPGNDSRAVAFVATWLTVLGIPGIIKVSKEDVWTSREIVRNIIDAGYPAAGLSVVCWDSKSPKARDLNFSLVDASQAVWAFGENATVDKVLRYEERDGNAIDHFSGKIVLRHATGRSAALVADGTSLSHASRIIAESAFFWPIGCKALKSVFHESSQRDELMEALLKHVEEYAKHTGDPLKPTTRVGYVDKTLLSHVMKRIHDLKRVNQLTVLSGEQLGPAQTTPLLLETRDVHSEFLSQEYSLYILCLKGCANYDEAVKELNASAGDSHRISVSVFSDHERALKTRLKAHHVKHNRHTSELDFLFHEGNDYLHRLTVPQIHRVNNQK